LAALAVAASAGCVTGHVIRVKSCVSQTGNTYTYRLNLCFTSNCGADIDVALRSITSDASTAIYRLGAAFTVSTSGGCP